MVYVYILTMALVTYLIRAVPLTLFRKKITNTFICSFLYYVPYACLTSMTFPAVLYATESILSATLAVIVAAIAAFNKKSLMTVACLACIAVFITELFI